MNWNFKMKKNFMIFIALMIVITIAVIFCGCSVCRKGVYLKSLLPGFMPNQTEAIRKHDPITRR